MVKITNKIIQLFVLVNTISGSRADAPEKNAYRDLICYQRCILKISPSSIIFSQIHNWHALLSLSSNFRARQWPVSIKVNLLLMNFLLQEEEENIKDNCYLSVTIYLFSGTQIKSKLRTSLSIYIYI